MPTSLTFVFLWLTKLEKLIPVLGALFALAYDGPEHRQTDQTSPKNRCLYIRVHENSHRSSPREVRRKVPARGHPAKNTSSIGNTFKHDRIPITLRFVWSPGCPERDWIWSPQNRGRGALRAQRISSPMVTMANAGAPTTKRELPCQIDPFSTPEPPTGRDDRLGSKSELPREPERGLFQSRKP